MADRRLERQFDEAVERRLSETAVTRERQDRLRQLRATQATTGMATGQTRRPKEVVRVNIGDILRPATRTAANYLLEKGIKPTLPARNFARPLVARTTHHLWPTWYGLLPPVPFDHTADRSQNSVYYASSVTPSKRQGHGVRGRGFDRSGSIFTITGTHFTEVGKGINDEPIQVGRGLPFVRLSLVREKVEVFKFDGNSPDDRQVFIDGAIENRVRDWENELTSFIANVVAGVDTLPARP